MTIPPCKDCEFRHSGCHSECSVYIDWSDITRKERVHTRKERAALGAMWDYNGRKRKK